MQVSNEEVQKRATGTMKTVSKQVRTGNVLQMDNSSLPQVALTWAPDEKHERKLDPEKHGVGSGERTNGDGLLFLERERAGGGSPSVLEK